MLLFSCAKTVHIHVLDAHTVMCQFGGRPEQKKNSCCTGLFYPVPDHMLTEINRTFSKPNCQVMTDTQALKPTNNTFCDEAALLPFAEATLKTVDMSLTSARKNPGQEKPSRLRKPI